MNEKQTKIYQKLFKIGEKIDETTKIYEFYNIAMEFITDDLNLQKVIIFEYNKNNGFFSIVKSKGYDNLEKKALKNIILNVEDNIIKIIKNNEKAIVYTELNPKQEMEKLKDLLFLEEGYFKLFGGDIKSLYGLIVVGNGSQNIESFSRISIDNTVMLALGNFIVQLSNIVNNILFFTELKEEKKSLEKRVYRRTKELELRTKELREQKESFEKIFYDTTDAMLLLDNGKFFNCNIATVKLLKYKNIKDILGLTPLDISPKFQPNGCLSEIKAKKMMQICIENGYHNFEWMQQKSNGEEFWCDITLTKIKLYHRDMIFVVLRDISKAKKLKENLIKSKQKAEEATKAKSEFLANMSHEIRTPMNGIIGMSHLALQTNLNQKQKNFIEKIDISAKLLLGIINDILDFSKMEVGKLSIQKEEFNLFNTIDSIINSLEIKTYEKNIELIVSYPEDLGKKFYGDSLRISQIIINLLGNAIKFTNSGEVGIYISQIEKDRYRFRIEDTGIGIDKDVQKTLFKAFSQADGSTTRKYGGTGLGLTICKQLVNLMDGKIWIESQKGVGSSFIFEIELEKLDEIQNYQYFNDKKILLVDDNKTWHKILNNILKNFGINMDSVFSGKEAIEILQKNDKKYDLILMDWNMPELDGIQTTKFINKNRDKPKPTTVIMLSFKPENIINLAKEVGIELFLQKPINPSLLNDILSQVFFNRTKSCNLGYHTLQEKNLKIDIDRIKNGKILLCEDIEINQEIIIELLSDSGLEIDIAFNGKEAIDIFSKGKYDLILMDLQMPIMDGFEATKRIREIDKNIPIIALTANAMKEDIEKTLNSGMNEHLNKPIDVAKLYKTIGKYILYKTDKKIQIDDSEEIPPLLTIKTDVGLKHLMGNKGLYLKILNDFLNKYENFNMDNLSEQEFKIETHTIKGLSANIGANFLYKIAKELDESGDKKFLEEFCYELDLVIKELRTTLIQKKIEVDKKIISKKLRNDLFEELKVAIKSRRVKNTKDVIKKILKYTLSSDDKDLFDKISFLIEKYDFKSAIKLF